MKKTFSHPAFVGRFGVARRDITPPLGIYARNWGAAERDVASSIHQPFFLTVLVMQGREEGAQPVALLSADLGWWRSAREEEAINRAIQKCGFSSGDYIITLSHTHSGPVFCPSEAEKPGGEFISPYLEQLEQAITGALQEARSTMVAGCLEAAEGKCALASNRDFFDTEHGRPVVGWNPEATADETLLLGRVSRDDGTLLALLVNYACHPTILAWENTTLSPDYIGSMREVVEAETGAPTLFIQGASGDLAARHQYVGEPAVAGRAGRSLGHAALGVLWGMMPAGEELVYEGIRESGAPLALWVSRKREYALAAKQSKRSVIEVDLPIRNDLASEQELASRLAASNQRFEQERLQRQLLLRQSLGAGQAWTARHTLWELGEVVFLSVPNEAYSVLQTSLRERAGKSRPLFIATLANSSRGYLPPAEAYALKNYAAWQSPFAVGCLEKTIAELQEALGFPCV